MASNPQHEPTMEEILASIRKIISEDSNEAPAAPVAVAPKAVPAPEPEPDVLELTQEVEEEPAPAPTSAPVAAAPTPIKPSEDIVFQTVEEPAPMPAPAAAPAPAQAQEGIFSDKTRQALDDAFSKLDAPEEDEAPQAAKASAPVYTPGPAPEGNSVEAVFERAVRDAVGPHIDQWMAGQKDDLLAAMKPLIREWMDEHFPALLEGAVREEVARVVKARGKR
ncbi:MAG TPA: DUF2497 domain-containing protein [Rhizomicrobium sp.]|jgi:hypothetical protein